MCVTPPQTSNCGLEPSLPAGGCLGLQGSPHPEVALRLGFWRLCQFSAGWGWLCHLLHVALHLVSLSFPVAWAFGQSDFSSWGARSVLSTDPWTSSEAAAVFLLARTARLEGRQNRFRLSEGHSLSIQEGEEEKALTVASSVAAHHT